MLSPAPVSGIALFLFAHQDDEFAVFKVIEDCIQRGQRPVCFYFTAGDHGGQSAKIRCTESLSVLKQLGVSPQQIFFIGEEHGIPDGKLHEHLNLALSEAEKLIASLTSPVRSLYSPAWEGGHQDHDAVNLLGRVLASKLDCLAAVWQSPFYHGCGLPWILYKVLSPLAANGAVLTQPLSVVDRLRYLKLCFTYKSQLKTWAGLLPFVIVDYLFDGRQKLQAVAASNSLQKPHQGLLLYEKRKFCSYDELAACGERFLNEHLGA
jgi:LmbE family N-acetylglucosaminyl deacetylase